MIPLQLEDKSPILIDETIEIDISNDPYERWIIELDQVLAAK